MKTFIAVCLSVSLILLPLQGHTETNQPPQQPQPESTLVCWFLGGLVLTCAVVGVCMVLYVHCKNGAPGQGRQVTFVLKKSSDNVNWTAIRTNTFIFDTNHPPVEIFREDMRDQTCFYKLDCISK